MSSIMFSLDIGFHGQNYLFLFYSYHILENGIFIVPGWEMKRKGEKERKWDKTETVRASHGEDLEDKQRNPL